MLENLRYAAQELGEHDIMLVIEMLNPFDVPDFIIPSPQSAFAVQDLVAS